jgi:hypothetical protein
MAAIIAAGFLCLRYSATPPLTAAGGVPRPDHVVMVIEENHSFQEIYNSPSASYINSLLPDAAVFTQSFAIEHPSQPNYFDLFSGSNQGVTDNSCPHSFSAANLGGQLLVAGLTFAGYSEDLPSVGSTVCTSGFYARKHVPVGQLRQRALCRARHGQQAIHELADHRQRLCGTAHGVDHRPESDRRHARRLDRAG